MLNICVAICCYVFFYCYMVCVFSLFLSSCSKKIRHTTKNDAYTSNFQPVNSDLSPFYSFLVLGPGRSWGPRVVGQGIAATFIHVLFGYLERQVSEPASGLFAGNAAEQQKYAWQCRCYDNFRQQEWHHGVNNFRGASFWMAPPLSADFLCRRQI